jgi:two-component system sensor histidine kinase KdpD
MGNDGVPGRGRLRVYLGSAPGSGKTFAMLREGRERVADGEDVVVGFVETYGRPRTVQAVGQLEVVPRLRVPYRGTVLEEMDLEALLQRRPQVALVDELAHTNAPGVRHPKRWEDVEALRDAGIDVVTTLNAQHVESVKDLVERITGIPVRETIPDRILDRADEVHFIDIAPEALRKRMRHGNIYATEKIELALSNFFRPGNLAALREIALRMVVQRSGDSGEVRPPPQDVLIAVSGNATSEALMRRGVRIARSFGGLCTAVMVVRSVEAAQEAVTRTRAVADLLQCSLIVRESGDVNEQVLRVARELDTRHVVIGESLERPPLWRRMRKTLLERILEEVPGVDVHVIARVEGRPRGHRPPPPKEARRRRPEDLLRELTPQRRGALRIYLGYARGCGATTTMLEEGRRRRERGTDVVVASVDTSGRRECEGALTGLELLGGHSEGRERRRLDVVEVLRRNPEVVCIDDLAGAADDGRTRAEVVPRFLDAGITVLATLHLADLGSAAAAMGGLLRNPDGARVVDDAVLDLADEVELVDVVPSVLDERLRRGDIVPPEEMAGALQGEFRPELLATLRTMAFRVIAEHTDRRLVAYMHERSIERPWEARARVMACIPPRPHLENLIRRAAKLAGRLDGELRVVTVRTAERTDDEKAQLTRYADLTVELGGEFVTLRDPDAAKAIAAYAREILATEILLSRGREGGHWSRGTLRRLIWTLSDVDIHVLARRRSDERPAAIRGTAPEPRRLSAPRRGL